MQEDSGITGVSARARLSWVGAVIAAMILFWPGSFASAQSRWTNYLDASVVREIVYSDGNLYAATQGGLLVYDIASARFTQYTNARGLPSNNLTGLALDSSGDIYVGMADAGVAKVRLSGETLSLLRSLNQQIDGIAGNEVYSVAKWDGDIVYGTSEGAGLIINDFAASVYQFDDGMPSNLVVDVLAAGDHAWMATDSGVVALDRFGLLQRPSGGPPAANVVGWDGQLVWVGTDDGVWTLDTGDSTWSQVGPAGRQIHSLAFDGQTMRAGGTRNYWEYLGGSTWTPFSLNPLYSKYSMNGSRSEIRGLVALAADDVYAGGGDPGIEKGVNLAHWDGQSMVDIVPPGAPGGNRIFRLSVDIDGSVWASFAGFWVGKLTTGGRWVNYNSTIPESDSLSNQFANLTCLADSQGFKWFCTLSTPSNPKPLDRLDDKLDEDYTNDEWAHYGIGSGGGDHLGSLRLLKGLEDPTGNRWFTSDDALAPDGWEGIQILNRDQSEWLQVTPGSSGLTTGNVVDVVFAPTFAYVLQLNFGVQRWRHGGYDWAELTNTSNDTWDWSWVPPGAEENPTCAAYRTDGVLWVGTTAGLYRFAAGSSTPDYIGPFNGGEAGLLGQQVRSVVLDHEENLWIATNLGVNRIARDDSRDIEAYSTAAAYQAELSFRQFPFEVISPLVNANCFELALHREKDILYIATAGGMSVFDYSTSPPEEANLSSVYVYPNPIRSGDRELRIENIDGPVTIEVYTLEGEVVYAPSESFVAGDKIWDLTTKGGFVAASGVYFVRIRSGSNTVVKPVSVIR